MLPKAQLLRFSFVSFLAAFALTSLSLPAVSFAEGETAVWFSDHKRLKAIDGETNGILRSIPLHKEPQDLAVDPNDKSLWVLGHGSLTKYNASGAQLLEIELRRLERGFDHARSLALNPYTGSLWVAGEHQLLHVSNQGQRLSHWRSRGDIKAIDLDIDESLWVLSDHRLIHLSPSAEVLASIELHRRGHEHDRGRDDDHDDEHYGRGAKFLSVDGLGGIIWVATKKQLLKFDLNRLNDRPQVVNLPRAIDPHERNDDDDNGSRTIRATQLHPVFGTLWVATSRSLLLFDRAGEHVKTVELPRSLGDVNAMAFDAKGLSLWIAGKDGVGRFTGTGELVAQIPVDKQAEHLGVSRFTLRPSVSILEPLHGAATRNPRPALKFSFGAVCSGEPCLLPEAYLQSLKPDVQLNGHQIGPSLYWSGAEAQHAPPARLPEGKNTINAAATDLFGHRSAEVTSEFIIDTLPPKFLLLEPSDGSTVTKGTAVISGKVDDPTANVILSDTNGAIAMGGAAFSFSVILKNGLNTFTLTASDPVGNEASIPLRITYRVANAVGIKITSPTAGTTLTQRGTIVSGDFKGPANTGITVNGVVAHVFGAKFYANLVLNTGPNTLAATATPPDGKSATDTVAVTVDAPDVGSIDISVAPENGIAPHKVRVFARSDSDHPITEIRADFDGDGKFDVTTTDPAAAVEYTYTAPGLYKAKIVAANAAGASRTERLRLS